MIPAPTPWERPGMRRSRCRDRTDREGPRAEGRGGGQPGQQCPRSSGAGRSPLRRSLGSGLPRWRAGSGALGRQPVGPVRPEKTLQLVITSTRPFQQRHLVQFDGIDSRDDADACRGREAPAVSDPEALFVHDLVGREVVDQTGVVARPGGGGRGEPGERPARRGGRGCWCRSVLS